VSLIKNATYFQKNVVDFSMFRTEKTKGYPTDIDGFCDGGELQSIPGMADKKGRFIVMEMKYRHTNEQTGQGYLFENIANYLPNVTVLKWFGSQYAPFEIQVWEENKGERYIFIKPDGLEDDKMKRLLILLYEHWYVSANQRVSPDYSGIYRKWQNTIRKLEQKEK
jgi:hypothetical protein